MHPPKIAYFISPHGYGHAARAAAVMAALEGLDASLQFEIFTKVPRSFFADSLRRNFGYHDLLTDIGLIQKNSLVEDLSETVSRLDDLLPFEPARIQNLAGLVKQLGCQLILCDIAPMGIAVAQEANIPSVLIENFTWDWIYEGYLSEEKRIGTHNAYLRDLFEAADYHIQAQPACRPQVVDLTVNPVSRKSRTPGHKIRRQLAVSNETQIVTATMGGSNAWDYPLLDALEKQQRLYFIIAGNSDATRRRSNSIVLTRQSEFFHPDLINVSDAVIGKIGYSTLAEVYYAGIPFGYLMRPKFRESYVLEAYVEEEMHSVAMTETQFEQGDWLDLLPDLLARPRLPRHGPNGADQIASFIKNLLEN